MTAKLISAFVYEFIDSTIPLLQCGESKTQRKWFLDKKRHGLVDENRVNNKENKNKIVLFMLYLFAYNINNNEKFKSKENIHKNLCQNDKK